MLILCYSQTALISIWTVFSGKIALLLHQDLMRNLWDCGLFSTVWCGGSNHGMVLPGVQSVPHWLTLSGFLTSLLLLLLSTLISLTLLSVLPIFPSCPLVLSSGHPLSVVKREMCHVSGGKCILPLQPPFPPLHWRQSSAENPVMGWENQSNCSFSHLSNLPTVWTTLLGMVASSSSFFLDSKEKGCEKNKQLLFNQNFLIDSWKCPRISIWSLVSNWPCQAVKCSRMFQPNPGGAPTPPYMVPAWVLGFVSVHKSDLSTARIWICQRRQPQDLSWVANRICYRC